MMCQWTPSAVFICSNPSVFFLNQLQALVEDIQTQAYALSSFQVRLTTMGLNRLLGTHTNQKHLVTLDILRRISLLLDTSIASHSAIWCLFLVAFFAFLRKYNLTTQEFSCTGSSAQASDPEKSLVEDSTRQYTTVHCDVEVYVEQSIVGNSILPNYAPLCSASTRVETTLRLNK